MKTLFVLLGLFGLSLADMRVPGHLEAAAKRMRVACMAETGAEEAIIDQARDGYIPDDPKLKCYILCLLEHYGMIKSDDEITWEEVLHLLPPNHVATANKAVEACGTIRGADRCETAYLTAKCYFAAVPENSRMP